MFDVTVIAISNGNGALFEIWQSLMNRQTFRGTVQYIIVDTSDNEPETLAWDVHSLPDVSLKDIIGEMLEDAESDRVLIMRTEDYYSPQYIEIFMSNLKKYDIVGEVSKKRYNAYNKEFHIYSDESRVGLETFGFRLKLRDEVAVNIENDYVKHELFDNHNSLTSSTSGMHISIGPTPLGMRPSDLSGSKFLEWSNGDIVTLAKYQQLQEEVTILEESVAEEETSEEDFISLVDEEDHLNQEGDVDSDE